MACMGIYEETPRYYNCKEYAAADEHFFKKLTNMKRKIWVKDPLINYIPQLEKMIEEYKIEYAELERAKIEKQIAEYEVKITELRAKLHLTAKKHA